MAKVVIYSSNYCPFCIRAKQLLDRKQADYQEINVDGRPAVRAEMTRLAGGRTSVPQIWVGKTYIGGCDELFACERAGQLDSLLAG
ncbi:glutaredoxin 3 [Halopseudomonas sp.]|uniref:glutaredoxin 3 n=1 Tax=Halopseudomonas sp. TaxID=2901191 RepID=UPI0030016BEC